MPVPNDWSPEADYWIERGRGTPVVFLHGYPLTHAIFEPQLEPVSRDHQVILLDLPGYGLAAGQTLPGSLAGFAERVHEFLAARFSHPVALVGHSFGGYIALEMYRAHPEQIGALVLTDTRSEPDTPEAKEKRLATARRLEDPNQRLDIDAVVRGLVAPSTWERDTALISRLRGMVASVPSRTIIATLQAIAGRADLTPVLPTIEVPTLVLWGEQDQLIPPAQSQSMIGSIPDCRGVGIPGAGHLPSLESPDAFSQAVIDFLRS